MSGYSNLNKELYGNSDACRGMDESYLGYGWDDLSNDFREGAKETTGTRSENEASGGAEADKSGASEDVGEDGGSLEGESLGGNSSESDSEGDFSDERSSGREKLESKGLEMVAFEKKREDEGDEEYLLRCQKRRERTLMAAMMVGDAGVLGESDVKVRTDAPEGRKMAQDFLRDTAKAETGEFREKVKGVIAEIATPMDKVGREGVYRKIMGDKGALELVYYATRETWGELREAREDTGEDRKKVLGEAAIEAFYKKFETAADIRELKSQLRGEDWFKGRSDEEFEASFRRMASAIYGAQEEYMLAGERIKAEVDRKAEQKKRKVVKTETSGGESVSGAGGGGAIETFGTSSDRGAEATIEGAIENSTDKSEKKEETTGGTGTRTEQQRLRTFVSMAAISDFEAATRARVAEMSAQERAEARSYNLGATPATEKKPAPEKKLEEGAKTTTEGAGETPEAREDESEPESMTVFGEVSAEKVKERLAEIWGENKEMGGEWVYYGTTAEGQRGALKVWLTAKTLLEYLPPRVSVRGEFPGAISEGVLLSAPFKVGKRIAMVAYLKTKMRNGAGEEKEFWTAKTVYQDSEGDFGIMNGYVRKVNDNGELGGINWKETDERSLAIPEGDVKRAIERVARGMEQVDFLKMNFDSRFFAAGTTEQEFATAKEVSERPQRQEATEQKPTTEEEKWAARVKRYAERPWRKRRVQ